MCKMSFLPFERLGRRSKRTDGRNGFRQLVDYGIAVSRCIHGSQVGIGVQHVVDRFHAVVCHSFCADADPFIAIESADLDLGVCFHLFLKKV